MAFKLIIPNIEKHIFEAYWYGNGEIESITEGIIPARDGSSTFTYVVNYGDDEYRCRYQDGRFGSGLHFSKVVEMSDLWICENCHQPIEGLVSFPDLYRAAAPFHGDGCPEETS